MSKQSENKFNVIFRILIITVFVAIFSFGSKAQYQINGDANQISCNCYQLTEDIPFSGGSVWNVNQIDLNNSFNFNFEVWLDCSEWGADGIAFVLQPVNINQGGGSSSLGYGGIVPSLIVEIDTWPNNTTMMDPQEDHIAIMQNGVADHGSVNNLAGPVVASSVSNNIEDCQWHTVQVIWEPTLNSLAVFFDGVFRTSYTGDVINTIFGGDPNVYWGWTGGTGSASADQRFCNSILPDYAITSNSTCVGDQITFEDASLTSSGNIANFTWDFGDGSTGAGAPVNHTYNSAGTFDVGLTISTEGCTEDTIIAITIEPNPVVDLGADLDLCIGGNIQLNTPNTLGSGTYTWSPITDLSSPSAASPTTNTTTSSNYQLTYISNNGCFGTDIVAVTVNPLPTASAGTDQNICGGEDANLLASGGDSYIWTPNITLNDGSIANPMATPPATTVYTVTVVDANNCTDSDDITVSVVPSPSLDAGPDENICEGDVVQLNAIGTGDFQWTGTNLSSTTVADPTAIPTTTITYYVELTDANNCTTLDSVIVDVDPIPVADFPDPVAVCDGNAVQFNDNSTGTITNYDWDFGDGTVGIGTNPAHIYPGIGTYNVTLSTTSANGCFATTNGIAEVIIGPIPVFSISNGPDFCEQEPLQIANNSNGPIVTYLWDFGDGNTSTDVVPSFDYSAFGDYTVSLTVGTAGQCFNSLTTDISVYPIPEPNFASTNACLGEVTDFNDQSSIPQGAVIGWEWSFGDATSIEYTQDPPHTYSANGAYTVMLISQSDEGCRDTLERNVYVNPTPVVAISAGDGCIGDETSFVNSTIPNDNTIVQWNWNFGDGAVMDEFEPVHVYGFYSPFSPELTAVSDSGCVGIGTADLEIYPYPTAEFSFSDNEGCAPVDISFTDESSIDPNHSIGSYEWDFGDGSTSSSASPNYTYVNPNIYDLGLIVTTAGGGCADTIIMEGVMSIYVTPEASFTHSPTNATMLDPRIRFTNTTVNGIDYFWDFDDGNISSLIEPRNGYPAEGDYLVTMTATNGVCISTFTQNVHIDPETFIYIPNSFTPNEDRLNDGFTAKGIGIEDFSMSIFDRWGEELYYTSRIDQPWNGTYKGKDCPLENYVYKIDIIDVRGENKSYCGTVNLIR
jgi:gliding motility-associated-like protein